MDMHARRAGDVMDCVLRSGARLNLQIQGTAVSISQQHWDLSQPPMQPSQCATG